MYETDFGTGKNWIGNYLRRASIVRDYGTILIRMASMAIISFFLTPILLQQLGQTSFGLWKMIAAAMLYVGLFEVVLRGSMVRFLAEAIGRKDIEDASRVVGTLAIISFPLLAIAAFVVIYFAPNLLSATLKENDPNFEGTLTALRLITIATVISAVQAYIGGIFQAMRRIDLSNLIAVPMSWLRFIVLMVVVLNGGKLVALGWTTLWLALFSLACSTIFLITVLKGKGILSRSGLRPGRIPGLARFIFFSGIGKAGDLIRASSGILLLGLVVLGGDPDIAAIFALVTALTVTAGSAVVGFADAASPRLYRLASKPDEMKPMIASFGAVLGAICAVFSVGFFYLGAPFITLWASPTENTELLVPFVQIQCIGFMLYAGHMMIFYPVRALNKVQYTGIGQLAESIVTLALAIIMMLYVGVIGVLIARVSVTAVYQLIVWPFFIRKVVLIEYRDYFWGCYCRPILAATLGSIPLAIGVTIIDLNSWPVLIGVGLPGGVILILVVYFIGINREKRQEIMGRVRDV